MEQISLQLHLVYSTNGKVRAKIDGSMGELFPLLSRSIELLKLGDSLELKANEMTLAYWDYFKKLELTNI